jgi:hypothetical protein
VSKAAELQGLADAQQGAAFLALCADFRGDPHAVLDYLDDLDRPDLTVLTVTVGRWFASQLIGEKADALTSEEQAREQVIAEARTFASEYALRLHAAQAEEGEREH